MHTQIRESTYVWESYKTMALKLTDSKWAIMIYAVAQKYSISQVCTVLLSLLISKAHQEQHASDYNCIQY